MPPLIYVLGVTLVPALLLLLLQILFAGSVTFLRANLFLLPGHHAVLADPGAARRRSRCWRCRR